MLKWVRVCIWWEIPQHPILSNVCPSLSTSFMLCKPTHSRGRHSLASVCMNHHKWRNHCPIFQRQQIEEEDFFQTHSLTWNIPLYFHFSCHNVQEKKHEKKTQIYMAQTPSIDQVIWPKCLLDEPVSGEEWSQLTERCQNQEEHTKVALCVHYMIKVDTKLFWIVQWMPNDVPQQDTDGMTWVKFGGRSAWVEGKG